MEKEVGILHIDSQKPVKVDDDNKQKKGGGNRRALQEIGNIVVSDHAEGKPQKHITCPITKTLCQLSLEATDQVADEKNQDKVALCANLEAPNGVVAHVKQPKAGKKVTYKVEPAQVIIISSDEEEEEVEEKRNDKSKKQRVFSESSGSRLKNHGFYRNKTHSLTSVLAARSKAASGVKIEAKEHIVDIDAGDANNELAVVEYVEDIFKFYKLTEDENRISDYMHLQPSINERMRMILVDWLVEVHSRFELMPETLYLAIDLVDRFLSRKAVPRWELQLVGIGSMLLACKYEEIWAPEVKDFVCISDRAYTKDQVLAMEKTILGELNWNLTVATPYVFLVRFIKAAAPPTHTAVEDMAFFLAETGLMYYPIVVTYPPSLIAAAAVYGALQTMKNTPSWTETLKHYTGYREDQLGECAKMLTKFHAAAAESKLKAVYRKFTNRQVKRGAVALFPHRQDCLDHQA